MSKREQLSDSVDPYGKTITICSWAMAAVCGMVMAIALLTLLVRNGFEEFRFKSLAGLGFAPVGGYMLGMAMAVIFAPASFLESEAGQKWMKQVGTKSVGSMRMVAGIFSFLGLVFLTFLILALVTDDFKQPLL